MRINRCGSAALLVDLDDLEEVLGLYAALDQQRPEGLVDLVPAARTLLVRVDPRCADLAGVEARIRAVPVHAGERPDTGRVEVGVRYDGEDLAEVGELTGLGERGVVEAHTGQEWTVAFCGFSPGFGYLVGEDDRLHVPRRSDPRTRVPAGAVALAGEFTGVYPRESPGGWQLIGHAVEPVWDLARTPPALLRAGVRVRFREAS
ncbi:MAG TPA: allophanate hydrolase subunit 1 [Segeticoccus sp.]|uniref:5-oxoprolinase subunit B family protein n=1 Tax=Segeticoccus sp. TaxID=2706531 RepID=UPI002D7FF13F|nr:allophanate hydrolase subunit 1 [Segeticoccus sp.]HET8601081.1 allophanate hydrolase subunit 1 [Segeticoccus sp.]